MIEIGKRYRFGYPQVFTTIADHTAHAGQTVTVIARYEDAGPDQCPWRIRADDGWEGSAYDDELEEQ